jgi:uridine kinase
MSDDDEKDIKIVVVAGAGKGKTTMCGLITEILSLHGFNVVCTDEDLPHQSLNIMDDMFKARLDTLLGKDLTMEVTSRQAIRRSMSPCGDKD